MSDTHTDEHADEQPAASPGRLLQQERERQGISLDAAALALHLRQAVVRGLEQDDYSEIPVVTYRRGYLRTYAKYLEIDSQPIMEAYSARHGEPESIHEVKPVAVSRPPSRLGGLLFKLVTLVVIAGLIGVTVLWWQSRGGGMPPGLGGDSTPATQEAPGAAEPSRDSLTSDDTVATSGREDADAPRRDGSSPDDSPVNESALDENTLDDNAIDENALDKSSRDDAALNEAAPDEDARSDGIQDNGAQDDSARNDRDMPATGDAAVADNSPRQDAEDSADTDTAPAADNDAGTAETVNDGEGDTRTLSLTFSQQSWTEIFDARDQRVFVGLQQPGTEASVEGQPPFRLTVGNASGVELRYQGENIDLAERAGANNVARFILGE
ncbi:RodZ domain-containing protein [Vreelandella jeotgali]|uniref:RodZ domain-containing protein n=1 Tax=Vreelandella jeotgali TaxID=553386 RepID=UPI0003461F10|nr:RodZ domain-containing protein [Halomonas jeotgali]